MHVRFRSIHFSAAAMHWNGHFFHTPGNSYCTLKKITQLRTPRIRTQDQVSCVQYCQSCLHCKLKCTCSSTCIQRGSCVSKTESEQLETLKPSFCLQEGGDCFCFSSTEHDWNTGKLKLDRVAHFLSRVISCHFLYTSYSVLLACTQWAI